MTPPFPPPKAALARLLPYEHGLLICPADRLTSSSAVGIQLPRFPESMLERLKVLCRRFSDENDRRGIVVLLLLDLNTQCWGVRLPPQRCAKDGVSWRLPAGVPTSTAAPSTPADAAPLSWVIAGTAQLVTQPEPLSEQVPPIDGVHFVLSRDPDDELTVDVVIVVGKRPTSAVLTDVLSDDIAELLNNAADRIELA